MKDVWTVGSLTDYCRFILGSTASQLVVKRVPRERIGGVDIATHTRKPILFFSKDDISRARIWHKCGHLHMVLSRGRCVRRGGSYGTIGLIPDSIVSKGSTLRFEERVELERLAHTWAILRAIKKGFEKVAQSLVDDMHLYWGTSKVYVEARRRVVTGLELARAHGYRLPVVTRSGEENE